MSRSPEGVLCWCWEWRARPMGSLRLFSLRDQRGHWSTGLTSGQFGPRYLWAGGAGKLNLRWGR